MLYNLSEDPEEQNNMADSNVKIRNKLIQQLNSSLKEMKAEMPASNPDYDPDNKDVNRKNLKFTWELAKKEREIFRTRLKNN